MNTEVSEPFQERHKVQKLLRAKTPFLMLKGADCFVYFDRFRVNSSQNKAVFLHKTCDILVRNRFALLVVVDMARDQAVFANEGLVSAAKH